MFALKNTKTGKLMGFSSSSNEGDFCSSVRFSLREARDNIWVVNDRKTAATAAVTDAEWYNADYDTPSNDYVGDLVVVELMVKA